MFTVSCSNNIYTKTIIFQWFLLGSVIINYNMRLSYSFVLNANGMIPRRNGVNVNKSFGCCCCWQTPFFGKERSSTQKSTISNLPSSNLFSFHTTNGPRHSSNKHQRYCSSKKSSNDLSIEESTTNRIQHDNNNLLLKLNIPTANDMEEIGSFLFAMLSFPPVPSDNSSVDNNSNNNNNYPLDHNHHGLAIFLHGDLGVGKTVFARGFVQAACGSGTDQNDKVTSPTFLLMNTYKITSFGPMKQTKLVNHIDLYRLTKEKLSDFHALDLKSVFQGQESISLVEWPSRLPDTMIPPTRLDIFLNIIDDDDEKLNHNDSTTSNDLGSSENTNEMIDTEKRILTFSPHGTFWENFIKTAVAEEYFDDLIVN